MLFPDFLGYMAPLALRVAALDDAGQTEVIPEHGTQQGKEPTELALPLVVPGDEAQREISK